MKQFILVCIAAACFSVSSLAQQGFRPLPRMLRFGGTILSADNTPRTGVVGVMFSLYSEQQGGTALWTELQNVQLDANGQYSVLLGSQHSEGVPAELFTTNEARWLGVQVEAEPEQPRVLLVSVPYALKAGDAETLGGKPLSSFLLNPDGATTTPSTTSGAQDTVNGVQTNSVDTGASGGTTNYVARWLNATTIANSQLTDDGNNVRLTTNGSKLYFSTPGGSPPYFSGNLDNQLDVLGATGGTRWLNNAGSAVNMVLLDNGNVGVGTGSPTVKLDVVGNARVYGNLTFGASNGKLLFNTPSGNAPYFTGNLDNQLDVLGAISGTRWLNNAGSAVNMVLLDNGNMGVGIGAPAAKLDVNGSVIVRSGGITFPDASTQSTAGITGVNASAGISGSVASGLLTLSGDTTYLQRRISGACSSGTALASVGSDGTVTCNTISGGGGGSLTLPFAGTGADNPPSVQGVFRVTDTTNGPANTQQGPPDPNGIPSAIVGIASGTGITAGVVGKSTGSEGVALVALNTAATANDVPVIVAWSQATSGQLTLFNGMASSAGASGISLDFAVTPQQIIGASVGNSDVFSVNGAGNIQTIGTINANGNIHSNGTISAPTKQFKIDHPLDPANKFLYHTSVESPDMKNVYDGVVTLDARGQASVELPDYFEALNQEFRYQLTAIGAPGPNLYIASEISGNRFRIAGGKPHARVSWQVTGIRHDAYADAYRTPTTVEKSPPERGTYLSPELFGKDTSIARTAATTPSTGSENK